MGVDTKAIIRKGTSLKEIKEVLEAKYGEVRVVSSYSSNYFRLVFYDGYINRMLSIFIDDTAEIDHNIDGVLLMLGCSGKSVEIMKTLLDVFGGYLDENDCDDEGFYPVNIEEFKKGKDLTEIDLLTNDIISKLGYEKLDTVLDLFKTYEKPYLKELRDSLNNEIIKINSTTLKDDVGKLDVHTDPMQLKSFARGKSIGLIISRDRINKIID